MEEALWDQDGDLGCDLCDCVVDALLTPPVHDDLVAVLGELRSRVPSDSICGSRHESNLSSGDVFRACAGGEQPPLVMCSLTM